MIDHGVTGSMIPTIKTNRTNAGALTTLLSLAARAGTPGCAWRHARVGRDRSDSTLRSAGSRYRASSSIWWIGESGPYHECFFAGSACARRCRDRQGDDCCVIIDLALLRWSWSGSRLSLDTVADETLLPSDHPHLGGR